jgi:hypothetical protein
MPQQRTRVACFDPGNEPRPDSGFVAVVSHDDLPNLLDQVGEALDFLEMHEHLESLPVKEAGDRVREDE